MLIDSHAHLSSPEYDADREEVLARCFEQGLSAYVEIGSGYGFESVIRARAIAEAHENVYFSVGLHPHDAKLFDEAAWAEIATLAAKHPKIVAIGECGYDFHYLHSTRPEQELAFRAAIELASTLNKPLIIHDREAHEETMATLESAGGFARPGVFHCFSGDWPLAERLLDQGWYIALGGVVTFAKALETHEVARRVPLDRLLLETDSPYLAPAPRRGVRNEPWMVRLVAERIAALRGIPAAELISATGANAVRLFRLPLA